MAALPVRSEPYRPTARLDVLPERPTPNHPKGVYVLGLDTLAEAGEVQVGPITAYTKWVNCRTFNAGD